jgi:hypothetical protein
LGDDACDGQAGRLDRGPLAGRGGNRIKVYQCGAKEESPRKLPDAIRGKQEVNLIAVMSATAAYTQKIECHRVQEPVKDGKTITQKGLEVVHYRKIPEFQRAVVGELAAGLNSLFEKAGAMEILKQ